MEVVNEIEVSCKDIIITDIIKAMSLASADSLMTTDSLRYNNTKPSNIPAGAATTNFGNLSVCLEKQI
jgi:hypothetical protein